MTGYLKYLFLLGFALKSFSQDATTFTKGTDYNAFEDLVNTAKNKSRNDYVALINKRLEDNEEPYIFGICDFIKQDSLIECIPNLKKYISNCNRENNDSACALYRLAQIGSEKDNQFITTDFQLHIDKKLNNLAWLETYLFSLERRNIAHSHDLLDKAFFDWTGINLNFTEFPELFEIKKTLENNFRLNFPETLIAEGYKLNSVIAFIDNTIEVSKKGEKPKARYIVEIELPYETGYPKNDCCEKELRALKRIGKLMNLPEKNIHLKYKDGGYYDKEEERFGNSGLAVQYIDYLTKYPDARCLNFIKLLNDRNYFTDDDQYYAIEYLNKQK